LKYLDPSGHVVQIGGWDVRGIDAAQHCPYLPPECVDVVSDIVSSCSYQAYDTIRSVDTYYTNLLESDDCSLTVTISDVSGTGAGTSNSGTNVFVTLGTGDKFSQRVANLAHEIGGHVMGKYYDTRDTIGRDYPYIDGDSQFEENLGDVYAFTICKMAGLPYTSPYVTPGQVTDTTLHNKYDTFWGPNSDYAKLPHFAVDVYNDSAYAKNLMDQMSTHAYNLYNAIMNPSIPILHY
jgi:hypothetical protein